MHSLWAISYFGRFWALEPHSMLRRNNLIRDDDLKTLAAFLGRFDCLVSASGRHGWGAERN
jgi:hypothetical protein